jgi:hypothetical protein
VSTSPSGGAPAGSERILWFGAGGLVVALVGGLVLFTGRVSTAPQAGAPTGGDAPFASGVGSAGAIPDISNMTPRERFDKLFDRIMKAAETGDGATVERFAPMALSAYEMLEDVDSDARYHAALIRLHTGDVDGAGALADTILKKQPGHLFGILVRGTIARFKQDQKALNQSYADFLAHYDAETKAKRPEYQAHPRALEQFLKDARAARGQS